jgi:aspartate carbamoyltransferase regulatory subunit
MSKCRHKKKGVVSLPKALSGVVQIDITITNSPNTTVIIDHSVNTTNNFVIIAPTPTVNSFEDIDVVKMFLKNPEIVNMPSLRVRWIRRYG